MTRRTNAAPRPDDAERSNFYPAMLARAGAVLAILVLLAGVTIIGGHDDAVDHPTATNSAGTPELPVAGPAEQAPVASEFGPAFGALTLELVRGESFGADDEAADDTGGRLAANARAAAPQ